MGDSDYLKHVSAEESIYSSDGAKSQSKSVSGGESTEDKNGSGATGTQESAVQQASKIDSHLKPFQPRQVDKTVDATTSDEVAEKMWGAKPEADPEFFI